MRGDGLTDTYPGVQVVNGVPDGVAGTGAQVASEDPDEMRRVANDAPLDEAPTPPHRLRKMPVARCGTPQAPRGDPGARVARERHGP